MINSELRNSMLLLAKSIVLSTEAKQSFLGSIRNMGLSDSDKSMAGLTILDMVKISQKAGSEFAESSLEDRQFVADNLLSYRTHVRSKGLLERIDKGYIKDAVFVAAAGGTTYIATTNAGNLVVDKSPLTESLPSSIWEANLETISEKDFDTLLNSLSPNSYDLANISEPSMLSSMFDSSISMVGQGASSLVNAGIESTADLSTMTAAVGATVALTIIGTVYASKNSEAMEEQDFT